LRCSGLRQRHVSFPSFRSKSLLSGLLESKTHRAVLPAEIRNVDSDSTPTQRETHFGDITAKSKNDSNKSRRIHPHPREPYTPSPAATSRSRRYPSTPAPCRRTSAPGATGKLVSTVPPRLEPHLMPPRL
jgi:hypothetical protein